MLNVGVCIFGVYLVVYARQGRGKELLNICVVQVCVFCVLLQGLWSSKFVRNDNQRKKKQTKSTRYAGGFVYKYLCGSSYMIQNICMYNLRA